MIVVDTNTLFCLFVERPETPKAQRLLALDPDWAAPAFWRIELLNALSNNCKFAGLPRAAAHGIWGKASAWEGLQEVEADFVEALSLSVDHRISGYDALFAAAARKLGTVCVTQDKAFARSVPGLVVTMDEFLSRK